MSSSHLFLGLPIALLVLYLVLSSRFQSAAFLSHLSFGEVAILSASFHFFFVSLVPATNLCAVHLFYGFFSVLFMYSIQSSSSIDVVSISSSASSLNERSPTAHVIVSCCAQSATAFIISATHFIDVNFFNFFVGPNILFLDLFVFPSCFNDET